MAKTKPPPFNQKHVRSSNSNLRFHLFLQALTETWYSTPATVMFINLDKD